MIEVVVGQLGVDAGTNAHVLILRERAGPRHLQIWIGRPEAEAIAAQLQGVARERPMTHDLMRALVVALRGVLRRVQVLRVQHGTYYGELHLERDGQLVTVDARPSDAIALALRCQAPIFIHEALLRADDDPDPGTPAPGAPPEGGDAPSPARDAPTTEALEDYLRRLGPEDLGKFRP